LGKTTRNGTYEPARGMNCTDQLNYACSWRNALVDVCEDRFGQTGQRLDAFTKALREIKLAAHGALGDLGNFGTLTSHISEEFDYLVLDQSAVNVKHDKYFAHEAILPDAAT
jgi:hypothetical protein